MCKYLVKFLVITWFILFFSMIPLELAAFTEEDYPTDINKYDFSLMGTSSKISPRIVIKMDNNWEILLACQQEKTKGELKQKGISFTDSQIMLLQVMRLLEVKGEKLKTTMPILGSVKMRSLRKKMRDLSLKIEPELRSDIDAIKTKLIKIGREENMYTILFSYTLDELAWKPFFKKSLIKSFGITAEKPFWTGVFWACYPPRKFLCGTNKMDFPEVSFAVNWGSGLSENMFKVFNRANWQILYKDYINYGKIINEDLKRELASYKIFNSSGNLTVPIIEEKEDSQLYLKCRSLAMKAAQLFLENVDVNKLMEEYEFYDVEKALVVSYHEWMWEYMDYLEEKGMIKKPFAFANPKRATPKDIGPLLYIMKRFRRNN